MCERSPLFLSFSHDDDGRGEGGKSRAIPIFSLPQSSLTFLSRKTDKTIRH